MLLDDISQSPPQRTKSTHGSHGPIITLITTTITQTRITVGDGLQSVLDHILIIIATTIIFIFSTNFSTLIVAVQSPQQVRKKFKPSAYERLTSAAIIISSSVSEGGPQTIETAVKKI